MKGLIQQFNALPRAAQWLGYLAVVLLVFFGVVKPLWSVGDHVGGDASKLESAINRHNELSSPDSGDGGYITNAQAVYGTPLMPKSASAGGLKPEAFTRVVDGILETNGITERTVTERKVQMSGLSPDQRSVLGVANIDRLIVEVTFEASPEKVAAILAELERAPEVAAVGRVRIDHSNSRNGDVEELVRATLTPEAWLASGSGSGSGPTSTPENIP